MSLKDARTANWVAETATPYNTGFILRGSAKGYTSFSRAFASGSEVFYSAMDERGNREAGYATFNGKDLISRQPTATLVNNVYSKSSPPRVMFNGDVTVACTFNASQFNTLWAALEALDPDGDGSISIPPELINGLGDALRNKADQSALDAEIAARIAGDQFLQDQIDNFDGGGLTDEERQKLNDAYGWGDHSAAGYLDGNASIYGGQY